MKIKEIIRNRIKRFLQINEWQVNESKKIVNHCCKIGKESSITTDARIWNTSDNSENITIGSNCLIAGTLLVWQNCGKIEIGNFSFVGENSRIYSAKSIKIGDRVQIAHGCNIFDNNIHSQNPSERHLEYIQNITQGVVKLYSLKEKEVVIKNDAWLGANVIILKGVTIGEGAIIGAGSVVTCNVPDHCIFAGNPAKFVKLINEK
jgi:acetyltransferase-like isoleucine patch superfamily enzyme